MPHLSEFVLFNSSWNSNWLLRPQHQESQLWIIRNDLAYNSDDARKQGKHLDFNAILSYCVFVFVFFLGQFLYLCILPTSLDLHTIVMMWGYCGRTCGWHVFVFVTRICNPGNLCIWICHKFQHPKGLLEFVTSCQECAILRQNEGSPSSSIRLPAGFHQKSHS